MARNQSQYWKDLLLAIVTFGYFMPWWIWRRDRDLRDYNPHIVRPESAWFLSSGIAIGLLARVLLADIIGPPTPIEAVGPILGILVFSYGVFTMTTDLVETAARVGVRRVDPAWVFPVSLALPFVGVELGHIFASWFVRGPVIAAFLYIPYAFYRVHNDFEAVEDAALGLEARPPSRPIPAPRSTS